MSDKPSKAFDPIPEGIRPPLLSPDSVQDFPNPIWAFFRKLFGRK